MKVRALPLKRTIEMVVTRRLLHKMLQERWPSMTPAERRELQELRRRKLDDRTALALWERYATFSWEVGRNAAITRAKEAAAADVTPLRIRRRTPHFVQRTSFGYHY